MPTHKKPREHYEAQALLLGGHYEPAVHLIYLNGGVNNQFNVGPHDRIHPDTLEVVTYRDKARHFQEFPSHTKRNYPPVDGTPSEGNEDATLAP